MTTKARSHDSRATRLMVWIPFAVALLFDAAYLSLIRAQDSSPADAYTVPFVAGYVALMAAMLGVSLLERPRVIPFRPALRAGAAAGMVILGAIASFTIGLPLLIAGAVATGAALRTIATPPRTRAAISEVAAALIAVIVLVGGFEVTERLIVCPPSGTSSGSGVGFVTGPYAWECTDGHLTFRSVPCINGTATTTSNGSTSSTSC
jgi:hypothetical protein